MAFMHWHAFRVNLTPAQGLVNCYVVAVDIFLIHANMLLLLMPTRDTHDITTLFLFPVASVTSFSSKTEAVG